MPKVRVYCDCNPTPIPRKQAADLYMRNPSTAPGGGLGFEPVFMVYDGTLNRASMWNSGGGFVKPPQPWGPEDNTASSPPKESAVKAIAKLSTTANTYDASLPVTVPLMFDLESPSFQGIDWSNPLPKISAMCDYMTNCLRWAAEVNDKVSVSAYWWPHFLTPRWATRDFWEASGMFDLCQYTCAAVLGAYNSDGFTTTSTVWFDTVSMWLRQFEEFCLHLPRIAVVSPTWAPNHVTPVERALWKRQLTFLTDRGCDLLVWVGGGPDNTTLTQTVKDLLLDVNGFQR